MRVERSRHAAGNQCPWTCRRHKLGVTGLAWSPDSALLASCSLDTDVLIWDAVEGHAVAVLPAHDSFVKGVAWDPVGSYVASFGEDFTVCIWSTTNWSCVAKVEENLQHMSTRALFCRCGSGWLTHYALQWRLCVCMSCISYHCIQHWQSSSEAAVLSWASHPACYALEIQWQYT